MHRGKTRVRLFAFYNASELRASSRISRGDICAVLDVPEMEYDMKLPYDVQGLNREISFGFYLSRMWLLWDS